MPGPDALAPESPEGQRALPKWPHQSAQGPLMHQRTPDRSSEELAARKRKLERKTVEETQAIYGRYEPRLQDREIRSPPIGVRRQERYGRSRPENRERILQSSRERRSKSETTRTSSMTFCQEAMMVPRRYIMRRRLMRDRPRFRDPQSEQRTRWWYSSRPRDRTRPKTKRSSSPPSKKSTRSERKDCRRRMYESRSPRVRRQSDVRQDSRRRRRRKADNERVDSPQDRTNQNTEAYRLQTASLPTKPSCAAGPERDPMKPLCEKSQEKQEQAYKPEPRPHKTGIDPKIKCKGDGTRMQNPPSSDPNHSKSQVQRLNPCS